MSSSSPSLQLRPSLPPTYLLFISCRFLRHGSHSSSPRDPPRIHPSLFLLSFDARGLVPDLSRLLRLRFPSPLPNRRPQEIRGYRPLPQATRKHSRPSSRAASLLRADISLFFDLSFQASPSFDPPFSPSPLLQGPTTRDPRSSSSEWTRHAPILWPLGNLSSKQDRPRHQLGKAGGERGSGIRRACSASSASTREIRAPRCLIRC